MNLLSTGSYVPPFRLDNDLLSTFVDTHSDWIIQRTGIEERRVAFGETTAEIGAKAGAKAIENSGLSPQDIDLIILATVTPDFLAPSTASFVQGILGIENAIVFDMVAGCTGFVYALSVAKSMLQSNLASNALIIGSEVFSKILNYEDRGSCILFGDGAGAMVLQKDQCAKILDINLNASYDQKHSILVQQNSPLQSLENRHRLAQKTSLTLDGKEVYKFAVSALAECVKVLMERNNLTEKDIAHIVPHQANKRIVDAAAKRLGMNPDLFYTNINRYGNTSSASIPIALDEINEKHLLKEGNLIILAGFGAGLTWGSVLIRW